ncbi:MAG: 50S ribosomal protein L9 [Verrucomicrobia bacterium]|nr:50S ribosomal protein L9 [Verrucomicrobiota bacterium]
MATEVLLLDNIPNVGSEGQLVTVADGYARNYLLPRDLAAPATKATHRRLAKLQQQREIRRGEALAGAAKLSRSLENVSITIKAKTSAGDKLYGSVTAVDIADSLKAQNIEVERSTILLENPIKELGVYNVVLHLHDQIDATIKVWVVEE